jgi:hypothetical protein
MREYNLTEEEQRIISRLRASPSFPAFKAYLERRMETHKLRLVETTDATQLTAIQGRAREVRDILEIITKQDT